MTLLPCSSPYRTLSSVFDIRTIPRSLPALPPNPRPNAILFHPQGQLPHGHGAEPDVPVGAHAAAQRCGGGIAHDGDVRVVACVRRQ